MLAVINYKNKNVPSLTRTAELLNQSHVKLMSCHGKERKLLHQRQAIPDTCTQIHAQFEQSAGELYPSKISRKDKRKAGKEKKK